MDERIIDIRIHFIGMMVIDGVRASSGYLIYGLISVKKAVFPVALCIDCFKRSEKQVEIKVKCFIGFDCPWSAVGSDENSVFSGFLDPASAFAAVMPGMRQIQRLGEIKICVQGP
jgi:hypothetical protein